ncbi:MAG: hypothetical protein ACFB0B_03060 [Thermonemataceae bacterium]
MKQPLPVSFTFLLLIFFISQSQAQMVNGVPVEKLDLQYIQLSMGPGRNNKVVFVDIGQRQEDVIVSELRLKDEQGKAMRFNSLVDVLNLFYENGYEYVDSYGFSEKSAGIHLLKKRK